MYSTNTGMVVVAALVVLPIIVDTTSKLSTLAPETTPAPPLPHLLLPPLLFLLRVFASLRVQPCQAKATATMCFLRACTSVCVYPVICACSCAVLCLAVVDVLLLFLLLFLLLLMQVADNYEDPPQVCKERPQPVEEKGRRSDPAFSLHSEADYQGTSLPTPKLVPVLVLLPVPPFPSSCTHTHTHTRTRTHAHTHTQTDANACCWFCSLPFILHFRTRP